METPDGAAECTPTGTLLRCLEDFGTSEPTAAIVIYINEDDDVCWSVSEPLQLCHLIGLLECVKAKIIAKFLQE